MDERLRFVQDVHRPGWSIAELCRRYEVSRKTGYKWLHAYERAGPTGPGGWFAPAAHVAPGHLAAGGAVDPGLAAPLYVGCAHGAAPAAGPRPGRPGAHQDDDSPDPRAAWAGASAAAQRPALPRGRTRHADGSGQRGLDRGFQGPIPHGQRRVLLSADGPGRRHAVPAWLPWASRPDHGREPTRVRAVVSALWPARADPHRQWPAVCLQRAGAALYPLGLVGAAAFAPS
jgi:hypothetical protein